MYEYFIFTSFCKDIPAVKAYQDLSAKRRAKNSDLPFLMVLAEAQFLTISELLQGSD